MLGLYYSVFDNFFDFNTYEELAMDTDPLDLGLAKKIFPDGILLSKQAEWYESEAKTVETDNFRADSKKKFSPFCCFKHQKKT